MKGLAKNCSLTFTNSLDWFDEELVDIQASTSWIIEFNVLLFLIWQFVGFKVFLFCYVEEIIECFVSSRICNRFQENSLVSTELGVHFKVVSLEWNFFAVKNLTVIYIFFQFTVFMKTFPIFCSGAGRRDSFLRSSLNTLFTPSITVRFENTWAISALRNPFGCALIG